MNKLKDRELNWNEWCNLPLAKKNEILDDIFDEIEENLFPSKDNVFIHEPYNDDKDVSDSRKKFLEWKAKQNAS